MGLNVWAVTQSSQGAWMGKLLALIFIVIISVVPLIALTQKPQPADLILHNGIIWTVDSKNSTAEAVAIREGKFIVVGTNKDALSLRGPKTQVIDLRGSFVTPGFNDNHVHFASAAQFLEFNIMNLASTDGQASGLSAASGALTTNGPRVVRGAISGSHSRQT